MREEISGTIRNSWFKTVFDTIINIKYEINNV